jgi:hypothetical protein
MSEQPDFLLTTHLDDDDAFGKTFVENLHDAARRFIDRTSAPLVRTFGSKSIFMWNLAYARAAPLGTRSAWTGTAEVPASGFSLLCKYPEVPLTILSIRHRHATNYLDLEAPAADEKVREFRDRLSTLLRPVGIDMRDHIDDFAFEDLSARAGAVIMANHPWNDVTGRLWKPRKDEVRVAGPGTFPDHCLNWDAAAAHIRELRPLLLDVLRLQWRRLRPTGTR